MRLNKTVIDKNIMTCLNNVITIVIYRCAKRISKDRVSSPREVDLSVKLTPARSPQQLMYNSDTVYTTTTFRPVSPSPITPPLSTPSPQRTRKLETPLHFDGGLFSDIRSTDGKLLSKVTVDRVQNSVRHDTTDSPTIITKGNNYINDIVKTETITNENVITVKFTPVPPELDSPRLLTPSQMYRIQQKSPVEYIKDTYEDLQSYKIVNSLCKDKLFDKDNLQPIYNGDKNSFDNPVVLVHSLSKENVFDKDSLEPELNLEGKNFDKPHVFEPIERAHSPLANLLISEQLTKIDHYLQESEVCSGVKDRFTPTPDFTKEGVTEHLIHTTIEGKQEENVVESKSTKNLISDEPKKTFNTREEDKLSTNETITNEISLTKDTKKSLSKVNSVSDRKPGVLSAIYNMPIHYHAAILCFLLIIYNLIYQYVKQNSLGNKTK